MKPIWGVQMKLMKKNCEVYNEIQKTKLVHSLAVHEIIKHHFDEGLRVGQNSAKIRYNRYTYSG